MSDVSLCITILNEEKTIGPLLDAVARQTQPPAEIIITDGGSTDETIAILRSCLDHSRSNNNQKNKADQIKNFEGRLNTIAIRFFQVPGNRSVGRNAAINQAKNDWIAITDAGCLPHPDWLEQLLLERKKSGALVIAGYYDALARTPLEEAMVPYVLVMPDKADPQTFLPATRSMLLHKDVWKSAGGFDERLSDNEDYVFARKIAKNVVSTTKTTSLSFAKAAKVSWLPRQNLQQFYTMLFRFARGDIQAGILRPKVIFVYLRYAAGLMVVSLLLFEGRLSTALLFIICAVCLYALWSISKNIRYIRRGWYWLPVLQYLADAAVMIGSIAGAIRRFAH